MLQLSGKDYDMATLDFKNLTIERLYRSFKWARNNSLQLFKAAQEADKIAWVPEGNGQHSTLYQFQCLITTTDAYYRRLDNHDDIRFGILVHDGQAIEKTALAEADIRDSLKGQLTQLERLLKQFDEKKFETEVQNIQSLANHEYLHQGQLVVMFRQVGIPIPERFQKAFDL